MNPAVTVADIMRATFNGKRTTRSPEYQNGVRAVLMFHIDRVQFVCRYTVGTAQADAFFAGQDEGRQILAALQQAAEGAPQ